MFVGAPNEFNYSKLVSIPALYHALGHGRRKGKAFDAVLLAVAGWMVATCSKVYAEVKIHDAPAARDDIEQEDWRVVSSLGSGGRVRILTREPTRQDAATASQRFDNARSIPRCLTTKGKRRLRTGARNAISIIHSMAREDSPVESWLHGAPIASATGSIVFRREKGATTYSRR